MTEPLKIAIAGALGRMGRAVAAMVESQPGLVVAARFDRPGIDAEGLVTQDEAMSLADVIIDFTTPDASAALAQACAETGGPALVVGATGMKDSHIAAIDEAALAIPIVRTGNYSLGVNILMGLVRQAARLLPPDAYDIEIFEAHHRHKVDSPSGTALMLGRAAAAGRGVELDQVAVRGRDGITGERRVGDIGFSVMRGGGIIGEHQVTFASEEEIVTLSHSGIDRSLFARGAVAAARWVPDRPPGVYDMQDVLGFSKEA
ncbi:4-hydroxy-tetrahydrodipicolinate reductase [Phenylobacterium soli]|uniref:4-hydroxy-tetrahydrodipicolinate reductase n=1 Tax=Phenylobacterium soli TaxID=2170551 RepID=A0A328AKW6_9CAUL|nr:4-hydroxy-tetrahydrodipicolinate reductase [Phenylobacterium soli]RAK53508.1 4-hydroxy-tetrahydrodipicolinate reductase [Phenylobacterium soli]